MKREKSRRKKIKEKGERKREDETEAKNKRLIREKD